MRILIVQDTDWIRRNPIQHTHLAERLALRGHNIRVIDYEILWRSSGNGELFSKRQIFHISRILENAKIEVIRPSILKIPLLDYLSMILTYSKEIYSQIHHFKPDIIIGNDILTPLLAYGLAEKYGIPTVFYAIDIEHRLIPFEFLQPLGKLIEAKNIKKADLVISINEGLREYTIKMGAKREKTMVIRAGIDGQKFNPHLNGEKTRIKYGIGKDDFVLFFMGWLYNFSGLKEVANELIKINNKRFKLLIVGEGDAYDDLEKLRDKFGVNDQIILTGKQPYNDLPDLISAADICILPAYNNDIMQDIVPIKLYEYMAMGKPVISTKLPGVILEFGINNGIIFINKPEDTLSKAIDLIDEGSLNEYGQKSRKFVENLTWDKITDEFEKVLESLI
jgi:glycosyltransferase involved in cell wall biosynthesis